MPPNTKTAVRRFAALRLRVRPRGDTGVSRATTGVSAYHQTAAQNGELGCRCPRSPANPRPLDGSAELRCRPSRSQSARGPAAGFTVRKVMGRASSGAKPSAQVAFSICLKFLHPDTCCCPWRNDRSGRSPSIDCDSTNSSALLLSRPVLRQFHPPVADLNRCGARLLERLSRTS